VTLKFPDLYQRWLPQTEVAAWDGFLPELEKRRAGKEQELKQVVAQAAEELRWRLDLTGEPDITLATGLRVKPLGGNQFEKQNPEGRWVKANSRRDLSSGELMALQGLSDLFLEVTGLRRARDEWPAALAEFQAVYQKYLAAVRAADPAGGADEGLKRAREFYAAHKPVLPAAARREFLGAKRQLLQGGFNQARSTGETEFFRRELREFFQRHREGGESLPARWEEEFRQAEQHKEYHQWLEAMRNAATEAEVEQAKKKLDSLLRQEAGHLPADARSEAAAVCDLAWQNFPPFPPANLQATRANEDGILITWDKARGAAGYRVHRADARTGENRVAIGHLPAPAAPTASLLDPEAETNREYFYWVTAGNAKGERECAEPVAGLRKKREGPAPSLMVDLARNYAVEAKPGLIADLIGQHPGLAEQLEPWRQLAQKREAALQAAIQAESEGDVITLAGIYRDDLPFAKALFECLQGAVEERLSRSEEELDAAGGAGEVEALKARHREMEAKLNELLELDHDALWRARITALIRRNQRFIKELEKGQLRRGKRTARPGSSVEAGREQQYQAAVAAGQRELDTSHFAEAARQADLALAVKPEGSEARKLKQRAEEGWGKLQEETVRREQHQSALAAGRAALAAGHPAEAILQADRAVAARPDDREAQELKAQAEQQRADAMAEAEARRNREAQPNVPPEAPAKQIRETQPEVPVEAPGRPAGLWIPEALIGIAQPGLKLTFSPAAGTSAGEIQFVARAEFRLGRARPLVDLVTWFWPRNPENDERTRRLSKIHVLGGLVEYLPALRDAGSTHGACLEDQPLSRETWKPLGHGGLLTLGKEYRLEVRPFPSALPASLHIRNLSQWSGPQSGAPPGRGAVRFQPVGTGLTAGQVVWLLSDAELGSNPAKAAVLELPGLAETQGRVHHHCQCFWLESLAPNGAVRINGRTLQPGEIAPLAGGQKLAIGPVEFRVSVE
jgi:hypothetical protein